jgi:phosphoadenosine phosphosulfate reductase
MNAQATLPFEWQMHVAKVDESIAMLKRYAATGAVIAYSGGKDSDTIDALARKAGLNLQRVYSVTTIDPPELVRHVRERGCFMDHPGKSYIKEIEKRGLPSRWRRWCCQLFKHGRTFADVTVLGVRAAESWRRAKSWKPVEETNRGLLLNPILGWSDQDVWQFLESERVNTCCLYREGYKRLGCMGCHVSRGSRKKDFARWPKVGRLIKAAFYAYPGYIDTPEIGRDEFWHNWVNDLQGEQPKEPEACGQYLDFWQGGVE